VDRKGDARRLLALLGRLTVSHWRVLICIAVVNVALGCTPLLVAAVGRIVVERFVEREPLTPVAGLWVVIVVGAGLLGAAGWYLMFQFAHAIAHPFWNRVFDRLLRQSLVNHERKGEAAAHTLLSRGIDQVDMSATQGPYLLAYVLVGVGAVVGLARIDTRWMLVAAPLFASTTGAGVWLARRLRRIVWRLIELDEQRDGTIGQAFGGARFEFIKRNCLEEHFSERFVATMRPRWRILPQRNAIFAVVSQNLWTVPVLGAPAAWLVARPDVNSVGEVVAVAALLSQALYAAARCGDCFAYFAETWPWIQQGLSVLDEQPDDDRGVDSSIQARDLAGQPLVLANLRCRRGGREVLRGIDLVVPPDSYTAIVGPNGGGKTTLLNVIAGVLKPDGDGSAACIGTTPIVRVAREILTRHVRKLDSTPVTFDGTARDNIVLLAADASADDIAWACGLAQIAYPLDRTADQLSDGEKIQMHVAQLVLTRPQVLLLDEGLKHLHPTARANVRAALRDELPGAAIFEVVHEGAVRSRVVTSIVVIEDGVVAERGTHDELIRAGGRYARYVADSER
jgi:ABC-type multidrug transport system fused ATPase/permease subunit